MPAGSVCGSLFEHLELDAAIADLRAAIRKLTAADAETAARIARAALAAAREAQRRRDPELPL